MHIYRAYFYLRNNTLLILTRNLVPVGSPVIFVALYRSIGLVPNDMLHLLI